MKHCMAWLMCFMINVYSGDMTVSYMSGPADPAGRTGEDFPEESTPKL